MNHRLRKLSNEEVQWVSGSGPDAKKPPVQFVEDAESQTTGGSVLFPVDEQLSVGPTVYINPAEQRINGGGFHIDFRW